MSVGLRALKTEIKTSDFELHQLGHFQKAQLRLEPHIRTRKSWILATSPPRRDRLPPHLRSEIHICRRENNTSTSRNEGSFNHLDPQMPPSVFEQGGLFSPLAPLHLGVLGEEIPNDPGKMFVGGLSWQVCAAETFRRHRNHSPFFRPPPRAYVSTSLSLVTWPRWWWWRTRPRGGRADSDSSPLLRPPVWER